MEVKKIVEGMTAVEVAEVIDSNFKNQNKILEEDIAAQNSVIGVSEYKDFSEAEAVNVGDVRKYNGFLYECVEATTGAFDASKWKKSSFKAETEKKLSELGSQVIYDVSANNDGATFASLSALLSSENLSTLIPIAVRCGGMSIRFAQTSDNNYIQARLMANAFTTDITMWQIVENEPFANSKNIVESGGIAKISQSTVDLSLLSSEKGWINASGEKHINDDYSLHKVVQIKNSNSIIITANDNYPAYLTFASQVYPESGDWDTSISSRIEVPTGQTQVINVPSNSYFLIIGISALEGGGNVEPSALILQYPTNYALKSIYDKICGYYSIDFSIMNKVSGWIGIDGTISTQDDAYHYVLPISSNNRKIQITANHTTVAVIVFASTINNDGSWNIVPGTIRYAIDAGTTKEYNVPIGTNYIIIGSKYGSAPYSDYSTPENFKIFATATEQIAYNEALHKEVKEIKQKIYGNFVVDFSLMEKFNGWISSEGVITTQADSYHYILPSNDAKSIYVIANPNDGACMAFASTINADGSWVLVAGTTRTIISPSASENIDLPSGTNYIIIGSKYGTAPSEDYCTPTLFTLFTAVNKEIELLQDNIESLKKNVDVIDRRTSKLKQNGGFTFAQYNIGHFSFGNLPYSTVTDSNYKTELKKYQDIIKKCDADIISLNEYSDIFCSDYGGDVMYARNVLFGDFPVRRIGEPLAANPYFCDAIFSYKMFKNIQIITLQSGEQRYCIISDIEIYGVTIKIVSYHCGFVRGDDDAEALTELSEIIALMQNEDYVIISADMNLMDKAHFSVLTNAGYNLANCGDFGDFETFIKTDPDVVNKCLDNIAVKGMRISNVRVVSDTDASDHLPLVCDLILTNI